MAITKIIRNVDIVSSKLCWISVVLLFIELNCGTANSLVNGMAVFLWAERIIAAFFLGEYLFRLYEDWKHPELTPDIGLGKRYITSFIGIVDLLAWLPFLIGFFIPVQYLGLVRAMRVLRLLKLFRYNTHLQLIASVAYKSWMYLKPLVYTFAILLLFNSVLIHQLEKEEQPESFGRISNCVWFCLVSASTVGYGDMAPKTDVGKLFTATFNFIPTIFVFSAMAGVTGSMFSEIIKENKNGKEKECSNN